MSDIKQNLINEVLRLVEENPNGTCTRDYFRRNSDYTEHAVKREFGTFSELFRQAGVTPGKVTAAYDSRKAALEGEVKFQEYFTANVKPWAREKMGEKGKKKDQVTMVVGSDFHGEHVNPFALDVFLDTCSRLQPEHIVLAGDIVNFEPVSRWSKNPNRLHNLQQEIDFVVNNILKECRDRCPNAEIDYVIGNHEYWLQRLLAEQAPGLSSLRCLSFGELFNLTELNIGLVFGGDMLAPTPSAKQKNVNQAWKLYYDTFIVTHGTSTGRSAASTELARFKISGCSGHLHTPATAFSSSVDRPHLEWNVLPMMCKPSVGEIYLGGLPTTWSAGFAIVDIFPDSREHFYQPVHCRSGRAMSAGVVYTDARK